MVERINKLTQVSRKLSQDLGRDPTPEELAEFMDLSLEQVKQTIEAANETVSLETPVGDESDSVLGDFIEDQETTAPADAAASQMLKEHLDEVLGTLSEREEEVIRLRFGLDDGRKRTLEEVGHIFGVTRERIRQIQSIAIRKLRHGSRSDRLRDYLS